MSIQFTYEHYILLVGAGTAGATVALTVYALQSRGSSDAAAWVQALGSVAAIALTWWIARQEDRRRAEVARRSVQWLRSELVRVLREYGQAVLQGGNALDQLAIGMSAISELVHFSRTIQIGDLEAPDADRLMRLRAALAKAQAGAQFFEGNGHNGGLHWQQKFEALAAEAETASV
jgi:hypothetical protein